MQVICLEEAAFYELIEKVVHRMKEKEKAKEEKWIPGEDALKLIGIGKTTLQKLRNEGKIRFSQPLRKVILYDFQSILKYLDENARNTF